MPRKPSKKIKVVKSDQTKANTPKKPVSAKKPKKKRAKKSAKKKHYYVNPAEFLQDITDYYSQDEAKNIPEKLGESVYKIASGLSYAPNFINYSYKDEMIGDAILKMITAIKNKKFDITSGHNPFSYFTTVAFHAFINRIKKEKKHHAAITSYKEQIYDEYMSNPENTHGHVYVKPPDEENDY